MNFSIAISVQTKALLAEHRIAKYKKPYTTSEDIVLQTAVESLDFNFRIYT